MKSSFLGMASVTVASTVCLVLPVVTSPPAAAAQQPVTRSHRPALAALVMPAGQQVVVVRPQELAAVARAHQPSTEVDVAPTAIAPWTPAEQVGVPAQPGSEFDEHNVTVSAAPTQVQWLNAISAAAYLFVAVPSLFFTVPFQILTGQSAAIVTSLNNIITAVNTILVLVDRSIPPIPTATEAASGTETESATTLVDETIDDSDAQSPPVTDESDDQPDPGADTEARVGTDDPQLPVEPRHDGGDEASTPDDGDGDLVTDAVPETDEEDAGVAEQVDTEAEQGTSAPESEPDSETDGNATGDRSEQNGRTADPEAA